MKLSEYGNYPDLASAKRVLVILFRNIGDVILTTPVFTTLKARHPHLQIDALVNEGTESMLQGNPHINAVHVYRRSARKQGFRARLAEELRLYKQMWSGQYDLVVSLAPGDRAQLLAWLTGARIRVGAGKINKFLGKPMMTHQVQHASFGRHYVERHLDCIRRIGVFPADQEKRPVLFESKGSKEKITSILQENNLSPGGYVLVHPTSRWMFKCLPSEKMAAVINHIQEVHKLPVVISSAPDQLEKEYVREMLAGVTKPVVDLSGSLGLQDLIALVRGAKVFAGVDSAPMHMASAANTPTLAIFGPSSDTDWGPLADASVVVAMNEYTCRPCQKDGCGGGKVSDCLVKMDSAMIKSSLSRLLDTLI